MFKDNIFSKGYIHPKPFFFSLVMGLKVMFRRNFLSPHHFQIDVRSIFVFISSTQTLDMIVSLRQERFQEIKCMMMVQTTHGLFLTYTQKFYLYIYIIDSQLSRPKPLSQEIKRIPSYLEGRCFAMVTNPHPLSSLPGSNCPPFTF